MREAGQPAQLFQADRHEQQQHEGHKAGIRALFEYIGRVDEPTEVGSPHGSQEQPGRRDATENETIEQADE